MREWEKAFNEKDLGWGGQGQGHGHGQGGPVDGNFVAHATNGGRTRMKARTW